MYHFSPLPVKSKIIYCTLYLHMVISVTFINTESNIATLLWYSFGERKMCMFLVLYVCVRACACRIICMPKSMFKLK